MHTHTHRRVHTQLHQQGLLISFLWLCGSRRGCVHVCVCVFLSILSVCVRERGLLSSLLSVPSDLVGSLFAIHTLDNCIIIALCMLAAVENKTIHLALHCDLHASTYACTMHIRSHFITLDFIVFLPICNSRCSLRLGRWAAVLCFLFVFAIVCQAPRLSSTSRCWRARFSSSPYGHSATVRICVSFFASVSFVHIKSGPTFYCDDCFCFLFTFVLGSRSPTLPAHLFLARCISFSRVFVPSGSFFSSHSARSILFLSISTGLCLILLTALSSIPCSECERKNPLRHNTHCKNCYCYWFENWHKQKKQFFSISFKAPSASAHKRTIKIGILRQRACATHV